MCTKKCVGLGTSCQIREISQRIFSWKPFTECSAIMIIQKYVILSNKMCVFSFLERRIFLQIMLWFAISSTFFKLCDDINLWKRASLVLSHSIEKWSGYFKYQRTKSAEISTDLFFKYCPKNYLSPNRENEGSAALEIFLRAPERCFVRVFTSLLAECPRDATRVNFSKFEFPNFVSVSIWGGAVTSNFSEKTNAAKLFGK